MAISSGLDIAIRALMAQQHAVNTTSHNISNANTPGFSRQRVRLEALPGLAASPGLPSAGGGVESLSVRRVRDVFVDYQIRVANHAAGRFEARAQSLQKAELVVNEPSDTGLRAVLSQFWNSWRDLANQPESSAARTSVIQSGSTLASTATRIYDSFVRLRGEADARVIQDVSEINGLTANIATLNEQIARMSAVGDQSSDLRDTRDLAVEQLARLVDIQYTDRADGRIDIFLGGHTLVTSGTAYNIVGVANPGNLNFVDLRFQSDNTAVVVTDGELRGLLDQRDTDLVARIADLNGLLAQVITDVNTAHTAGFGLDSLTGRAFFTGTNASDINVNPVVSANTNAVAASTTLAGVPGNAANAIAISALQYTKPLLGATATYDEFYQSFVSSLGSTSRQFEQLDASQAIVVEHLTQIREGASGVNLDEEMVQLMSYQRAYEAASRLVSVIDELLDTLINRMAV